MSLEFTQDNRPVPCCTVGLDLPSSQHWSSALPLLATSSGSLGAVGLRLASTSTEAESSDTWVLMVDAAAEGDSEERESV